MENKEEGSEIEYRITKIFKKFIDELEDKAGQK